MFPILVITVSKINSVVYLWPHQCGVCCKSLLRNSVLKQLMTVRTGERYHQGNVCCKSFLLSRNLQYHINIHTEVHTEGHTFQSKICCKSFSLDVCYKSFYTKQPFAVLFGNSHEWATIPVFSL
ncbi:unnamed protein product [Clavelina lepadiformis]|uniref:C2H2-type domain-containing protein n=1 Tax=Clavelina lepadiformis TaxID=159417 RepID=A0ABP0G3D4_CLALP